jgi:uncharacterized protein YegP (UPF0339 family)
MTDKMHVEIFKSRNYPQRVHPWYVRLVADNGSKLATSEGYFSKWNARRAAKRMFPELEVEYVEQ